MRSLLILSLLFAGCVGSSAPQNPMMKAVDYSETVWWRLDTSDVKPEDNPWNKFVPTYSEESSDPWSDFEEPKLFPDGWKARKHLNPDEQLKLENLQLRLYLENAKQTIKELRRPKVEKTLDERLKELRQREREYFKRSI